MARAIECLISASAEGPWRGSITTCNFSDADRVGRNVAPFIGAEPSLTLRVSLGRPMPPLGDTLSRLASDATPSLRSSRRLLQDGGLNLRRPSQPPHPTLASTALRAYATCATRAASGIQALPRTLTMRPGTIHGGYLAAPCNPPLPPAATALASRGAM